MKKRQPEGWGVLHEEERLRLGQQDSREHHWWPRALQKHWAVEGFIFFENSLGGPRRKSVNNRKFCADSHAHTKEILINGGHGKPSKERIVFESIFRACDNDIPEIVRISQDLANSLLNLPKQPAFYLTQPQFSSPLLEVDVGRQLRLAFGRLALSLVVRSPTNRARHHETINTFFGMELSKDQVKGTIAHDIQRYFEDQLRKLESLSQKIDVRLLVARDPCFIFSDGVPNELSEVVTSHPTRYISVLKGRIGFALLPTVFVELVFSHIGRGGRGNRFQIEEPKPSQIQELNNEVRAAGKDKFIQPRAPDPTY